MTLPSVVQLVEYQSGELFERQTRGPGTYVQIGEIRGNSFLSSIFIESIDPGATIKINYYDTTTSPELGERFDLTGHDLITDSVAPLTTLRILVTRLHHKLVAEAIVTGGNASFSLYATVIASSASDLDQSLVKHLEDLDLLNDKGVVVAGYDATLGKAFFLPIEGGAVKTTATVTGTVNATIGELAASEIQNETLPTADTEVAVPLPPNVRQVRIAARDYAPLKLSWVLSESGSKFVTIHPGTEYKELNLAQLASRTVYLQSPIAGVVVELETWT